MSEPCDKLFDALLAALNDFRPPPGPADVMEAMCALAATAIRNIAPFTERTEAELARHFGKQLLHKLEGQPTERLH